MGNLKFIDNIVEQKLLSLHTCFLAKILSTNGKTAKIQPLGKTKAYGKDAVTQPPITNVPIINSARYRFKKQNIKYVEDVTIDTNSADGYLTRAVADKTIRNNDFALVIEEIKAGDVVVCVCGERNITDARKGVNSTPPAGHHSMSDAIIIGLL